MTPGASACEDGVAAPQADTSAGGLMAPDSAPEAAQEHRRDDSAREGAQAADDTGGEAGPGASNAEAAAPPDGLLPAVSDDAEIAMQLGDMIGADDVNQREARLRQAADLPTQPTCVSGTAAIAVDLVERVLRASAAGRDAARASGPCGGL